MHVDKYASFTNPSEKLYNFITNHRNLPLKWHRSLYHVFFIPSSAKFKHNLQDSISSCLLLLISKRFSLIFQNKVMSIQWFDNTGSYNSCWQQTKYNLYFCLQEVLTPRQVNSRCMVNHAKRMLSTSHRLGPTHWVGFFYIGILS